MKYRGSGPPLCTHRLNWTTKTSWGWWDDTALQTHDSKFEPWWSEAKYATSRSLRLPTILNLYEWAGRKHFCSLKLAWRACCPAGIPKESTCNWGGKLVDNTGVFHMDFFMCIIDVDLHVDIKWHLSLIFFSLVIHVAFLMWIIGVHFQVYST